MILRDSCIQRHNGDFQVLFPISAVCRTLFRSHSKARSTTMKRNTVFLQFILLLVFTSLPISTRSQKIDAKGKLVSSSNPTSQSVTFYSEGQFCHPNPKIPFYQREADGAVCCKGKELLVITLPPEVSGDCALSTQTSVDGIIDPQPLVRRIMCSSI